MAGKARRDTGQETGHPREKPLFLWALVLSLLLHLSLLPWITREVILEGEDAVREMEVTLEVIAREEDPLTFVETNQDDPSNLPDDPDFFAARDAQAAQEEPIEGEEMDIPELTGDEEEVSRVVEGTSAPPVPVSRPQTPGSPQPGQPLPPSAVAAQQPTARQPAVVADQEREAMERDVSPEDEESPEIPSGEGDAPLETVEQEKIAVNLDGPAPTPDEASNPQESQPGEPLPEGEVVEEVVTQQPRPRLPPGTRGPTLRQQGNLARLGVSQVSAEFREYGQYLQAMFEVIEQEWYRVIMEQSLAERFSFTVIEFQISSDGKVLDFTIMDTTSSLLAQKACAAAIVNRAPYGEWTADMVSTLNDPETIRVTFNYQ